jgi:beta-glucosidase
MTLASSPTLSDWQNLSLPQLVGQMVVVRASGHIFDQQIRYPAWEPPANTLRQWLQELNIGGVILLGGSAVEVEARSRQLQTWAQTPLLIAADIEEGVGQRFAGATWMPPPMAISATSTPVEYAEKMGAITAQEALAIGINWILAPVVDVNNNPDNPVINVRAFGETPDTVRELATAFIRGAKSYPVLTTAKHFPGHGDTATDSHLGLPTLPHDSSRLEKVELPPFIEAINAGVDSVMSAHLLIPAWDRDNPATLSPTILTGKLRQKLGFTGLIVTDALIMGGVTKVAPPEEIAIRAVEAGADILLMPSDPRQAIAAVVAAVEGGRIPRARIQASVQRIFTAKQRVIPADPLDLFTTVASASAEGVTKAMLRDSLQTGGNLPLAVRANPGYNLIVVDEALHCSDYLARHTPAVAYGKQLGYETVLLDQHQPFPDLETVGLLQVFVRGNPFRGSAGLTPQAQALFKKLLRQNTISGIIIYGSPYILKWLQPQLPSGLPWVFSYGQMPLAQRIAFQTLFQLSSFDDFDSQAFI